jgi:hypothetical protein
VASFSAKGAVLEGAARKHKKSAIKYPNPLFTIPQYEFAKVFNWYTIELRLLCDRTVSAVYFSGWVFATCPHQ